ncbi:hypothetical protein DB347_08520 [Opitutaceae bacterium EW11]|nr:hypothetical protein DB347_08520 [Opitutaceae bacterium EW11]
MPDRVDELLRQRRLIQEHLAWLDREIARETGKPAAVSPLTSIAHVLSPAGAQSPAAVEPSGSDPILAQYEQNPQNLQQDVRKGCLTAFAIGMALFLGSVGIAYFFYARHLDAKRAGTPGQVQKMR